IVAEIEHTLLRPEYRALRDADGARRELAFTLLDGDACFEGTLDLVAPSRDGYRILDVKSGSGMAGLEMDAAVIERRVARYDIQRTLYTRAVEKLTGVRVAGFAFDFTGAGVQADATLTPSTSGGAAERLAAELAQLASGADMLTTDTESCNFCGYRTAGWCPGAQGKIATSLTSG
ncbi:MAG: PD-(D/E)XK nuclease family protein, partial [Gemmatimonadota bacterium]|nr:PD-(D/E)XK nuclease family protein [Gemmatimonadota bacterium]